MSSCEAAFANRPGIIILKLSGEIDFSCYRDLMAFLKRKLGADPRPMVFDLSAVSFMDSTGGLRLLLEISDAVGRHRFAVAGANKNIANLMRSANISHIPLCRDIPTAAAACGHDLPGPELKKSA